MKFFYNLFVSLYPGIIRLASLWNPKAKLWIHGRKDQFKRLEEALQKSNRPLIWFHCASLGEFEQGRPVIESIKDQYPQYRILLTFFSPSGYEVRKNYSGADLVFYLPMDSLSNANRFIGLTKPKMAFFIKYETWFHYLSVLKEREIPCLLISGILLESQFKFPPWGNFMKSIFDSFTYLFAQSQPTISLLKKYKIIAPYGLGGDTRFDRVLQLSSQSFKHPQLAVFAGDGPVLVAGSTWEADENLIAGLADSISNMKLVIAPHEIGERHIHRLQSQFPRSILYSEIENHTSIQDINVVIIDCVGLLSKLYRYGTTCYVGGGFNRTGIHNILEAAAYGKTVFIGPNYNKANEAKEMIEKGLVFSCRSKEALTLKVKELMNNPKLLEEKNKAALVFVQENQGATARVLSLIKEQQLL